jgi:hypothetical protein
VPHVGDRVEELHESECRVEVNVEYDASVLRD